MAEQAARLLASYGRRRGRKLRAVPQQRMDELLPRISLNLPPQGMLDVQSIFPSAKEIWLEVGFGGGEHMAALAAEHRDVGFIGAEPYVNGISLLLNRIEQEKLENIRLFTHDVRILMAKLPDGCLSKIFTLYADPWPKARHHKRRLIQKPFLDEAARLLKPGGLLQLASDDADYVSWMLEHTLANPHFRWTAQDPQDFRTPPQGWVSTRYEQKAIAAGRVPAYLGFTRNA